MGWFIRLGDFSRVALTRIAQGLGFVGLATAFLLAAANYRTLTGSDSPAVNAVPLLLAVAGPARAQLSPMNAAGTTAATPARFR